MSDCYVAVLFDFPGKELSLQHLATCVQPLPRAHVVLVEPARDAIFFAGVGAGGGDEYGLFLCGVQPLGLTCGIYVGCRLRGGWNIGTRTAGEG